MSTVKKAVLNYAEFLTEKINQNMANLSMIGKGSKSSKEVKPDMADLPSGKGKKVGTEVKPKMAELPKGGKNISKSVKSDLSNLNKGSKGKASKAELDPKFAKMPSVIKNKK